MGLQWVTFETFPPLTIFAEPELPEEVLPVPPAFQPSHTLASDTGQMKQDSMGFTHGVCLFS